MRPGFDCFLMHLRDDGIKASPKPYGKEADAHDEGAGPNELDQLVHFNLS